MNAFTRPIIIDPATSAFLLERIPLTSGGEGQFNEKWLQTALYEFPECLPIKEIDPHIGPLIPVCMEIETGSGPADILYVTPSGQIVLVETKLWRNPEARREVVGQILDYAKQLTSWTYDRLDSAATSSARSQPGHLLRCLRSKYPDVDEATFVDGVGRSLKAGDFLLLIVGDGIQYGAEALVSFLENYGHLRFGLGLIEVAAFRLPGGQTLLQPRVLAKTELMQRTIILGPNGPISFQQAAQAEDAATPNSSQRQWFSTFWEQFLTQLRLDDETQKPTEPAKSTNQFFPMPPKGGVSWISAYIAQSTKRAGVYLTFTKTFERGPEIYQELLKDRDAIDREIGVKVEWERVDNKVYVSVPAVTFSDLDAEAERKRVIAYLADMTPRLIKVLRPRLEALA